MMAINGVHTHYASMMENRKTIPHLSRFLLAEASAKARRILTGTDDPSMYGITGVNWTTAPVQPILFGANREMFTGYSDQVRYHMRLFTGLLTRRFIVALLQI